MEISSKEKEGERERKRERERERESGKNVPTARSIAISMVHVWNVDN